VSDLQDRGLRNPRHTFSVASPGMSLMPTFMAPLRPNETVIGMRYRAEAILSQMCSHAFTVPMEVEFAVWKVAVRQIGEFFIDMFVNDLEDQPAAAGVDSATGMRLAGLPINAQGQKSRTPLQTRDRPWAGENALADSAVADVVGQAYAPYTSHALWHIARMCYDMEFAEVERWGRDLGPVTGAFFENSQDLHQTPPRLGRLVRGAVSSAMGFGQGSDNVSGITSMADWAERLSVVDNPNRTYQEYLKAFGVNPSRIPGLPEPVMIQRRRLHPLGSPQFASVPTAIAGQSFDRASLNRVNVANSPVASGLAFDGGGTVLLGTTLDEVRGKRLIVDEPSFLVGTVAWWPHDFDWHSGAHVFDAAYLINSGTWGDPTGGAVDERDFLISRTIDAASQSATDLLPAGSASLHLNDAGQGNAFVINLLNLFLNGDSYCNNSTYLAHVVPPLSRIAGQENDTTADPNLYVTKLYVNTRGDVRIGIATDLVRKGS
jgi:hypothetical protein